MWTAVWVPVAGRTMDCIRFAKSAKPLPRAVGMGQDVQFDIHACQIGQHQRRQDGERAGRDTDVQPVPKQGASLRDDPGSATFDAMFSLLICLSFHS
jgi:hypothetical protein